MGDYPGEILTQQHKHLPLWCGVGVELWFMGNRIGNYPGNPLLNHAYKLEVCVCTHCVHSVCAGQMFL